MNAFWHRCSEWCLNMFEWTWHTSFEASVLLVFLVIIQLVLARWLTPAWRYAFSFLFVLRLLMPAVPFSPVSYQSLVPPMIHASPVPPAAMQSDTSRISGGATRKMPMERWKGSSAEFSTAARFNVFAGLWLIGVCAVMSVAVYRQWKWTRILRHASPVKDPSLRLVFKELQRQLRIRRRIRLIQHSAFPVPVVCGVFRPSVVLPGRVMTLLTAEQFRMVLLHELIHVRRWDVLQNWVLTIVTAVHWFNPLVWWGMNRLRDDRELLCDALILDRLKTQDRQFYGETLITLSKAFNQTTRDSNAVPILKNRTHLERRIHMIKSYRKHPRAASALAFAVLAGLIGLTFTEAQTTGQPPLNTADAIRLADMDPKTKQRSLRLQQRGVELLEKELAKQNARVAEQRNLVHEYQDRYSVPTDSQGNPVLPSEEASFQRLEDQIFDLRSEHEKAERMFSSLNSLIGDNPNYHAIADLTEDPLLQDLLSRLAEAEIELEVESSDKAEEHPAVKRLRVLNSTIEEQLMKRVRGIFASFETKSSMLEKSMIRLQQERQYLRQEAAKESYKYSPVLIAIRDLKNLERIRDAIQLRLLQEKMDQQLLEESVQPAQPEKSSTEAAE